METISFSPISGRHLSCLTLSHFEMACEIFALHFSDSSPTVFNEHSRLWSLYGRPELQRADDWLHFVLAFFIHAQLKMDLHSNLNDSFNCAVVDDDRGYSLIFSHDELYHLDLLCVHYSLSELLSREEPQADVFAHLLNQIDERGYESCYWFHAWGSCSFWLRDQENCFGQLRVQKVSLGDWRQWLSGRLAWK